jgi:hypothetical protein
VRAPLASCLDADAQRFLYADAQHFVCRTDAFAIRVGKPWTFFLHVRPLPCATYTLCHFGTAPGACVRKRFCTWAFCHVAPAPCAAFEQHLLRVCMHFVCVNFCLYFSRPSHSLCASLLQSLHEPLCNVGFGLVHVDSLAGECCLSWPAE